MSHTPGVGRGFGIGSSVDHSVVRAVAAEVERLGYTSFWVNDTPRAEGLASLAAASAVTSAITLGVGVIPLDQQSPAIIGERLRALGLPVGRLLLGVGSGRSPHALETVRVGAAELKSATNGTVIVGALGPKMSMLAGEAADGVLLNWMSPDYEALIGQSMLDVAARAGRPRPLIMAYVRCGFAPHAEARLREELAHYVGSRPFEQHVERMGVGARETCVLASDGTGLQAGLAGHEAVLDETIVRAITPSDSVDDLIALARACAPPTPVT